jgi:hypothetical protein
MQPQAPGGPGARRPRRASVFAAEGLTVPKLNLGETAIQVDIKNGIGTIKKFSAKSKDGELALEGKIEFRDPFKQSKLPGCLRFKLSDALKTREPDFGNIEFMLPEMSRQPDGEFAIPTKGTLAQLGWDVRRRCSSGDEPTDGERSARPVITERAPDMPPTLPPAATPSEEEKARQAGMQPAPGEPGAEPGGSGPALSPTAIRGAADDVRARDGGVPFAPPHDAGLPPPPPQELVPPPPPEGELPAGEEPAPENTQSE